MSKTDTFDRVGTIRAAAASPGQIFYAPHTLFQPNPDQPRQTWIQGDIDDMARSVASFHERGLGTGGSGFIYPLKVRLPKGSILSDGEVRVTPNFKFIIIAGETKWRSAIQVATEGALLARAPIKSEEGEADDDSKMTFERVIFPDLLIPFIVEDVSEEHADEISFVENQRRTDLNPLDEANYFLKERLKTGLSLRKLAVRFDVDVRYITHRLALLKSGEDTQALVRAKPSTFTTALIINEVQSPALREELIAEAAGGTSRSQIEAKVSAHLEEVTKAKEKAAASVAAKAPDTDTQKRAGIQQERESGSSTRGGGASRGRTVTGVSKVEARQHVEEYLPRAQTSIASARTWMEHLTDSEKAKLIKRYVPQIEAELKHLKELLET